ncbi:hypothetical protein OG455_09715 [Kitasatospora sp. NBC_01287]|uniref:hypothetical protein n=1 Tax=Kitasatospora sp. NBC_01287 TaxID=2903573 RepID=UPI00224C9985|nr:hypothetical protein [Kitasatospora sp. NBC_01287]MCX4745797.1 hypothetical protein [Kitasatospora sp. NBC_01287]
MGATFYISADRQAGAAWTFTADQLARAVPERWPGATVSEPADGLLVLHVPVEDHWCEVFFDPEYGVLSFADKEPWSAPLTVVHGLLRALAPAVPLVRWADYDAELEPIDLNLGLAEFVARFGA